MDEGRIMIIQIDSSSCDDSENDTMLELWNNGDSLEIGVKYEWNPAFAEYKEARWVDFRGVNLKEFFNSVKALEQAMKESGDI